MRGARGRDTQVTTVYVQIISLVLAGLALIMGGALWLATSVAAAPTHGIAQAVILLLLIAGGIAAYALFLTLFAVTSWREAVNAIRQGRPRDLHTDLPTDLRA